MFYDVCKFSFVQCLKNQKDPTFDMHLVVYCMTKPRRQKADRRKIQSVGEVWKTIFRPTRGLNDVPLVGLSSQ